MNLKPPIRNEDAERDCTRVIELDSKSVKAWFRRGQARISLSHLEDAKSGKFVYTVLKDLSNFELPRLRACATT